LDAEAITLLRAQRFAFLQAVFEECGGSTSKPVHQQAVAARLGYDKELADNIGEFLVGEHLLDFHTFGPTYVLTHEGVQEVEEALAAPERPTEHFPAIVIAKNYIQVGSMVASAIQQGSHDSTQIVESQVVVEALRQLAADLRAALTGPDLDEDAAAQLARLDEELAAPKPRRAVIRETLRSLQAIVEGAFGAGLAANAPHLLALAERLAHALSTLG